MTKLALQKVSEQTFNNLGDPFFSPVKSNFVCTDIPLNARKVCFSL